MARKRAISVTGGSVQLRLAISSAEYLVDVWKAGARWKWSARPVKGTSVGEGEREKWSEARTAAFRACIKHSTK